jgi:hypothetical protein
MTATTAETIVLITTEGTIGWCFCATRSSLESNLCEGIGVTMTAARTEVAILHTVVTVHPMEESVLRMEGSVLPTEESALLPVIKASQGLTYVLGASFG